MTASLGLLFMMGRYRYYTTNFQTQNKHVQICHGDLPIHLSRISRYNQLSSHD